MKTGEVSGTWRHNPETQQGLRWPLWSSQTGRKVQRGAVGGVAGGCLESQAWTFPPRMRLEASPSLVPDPLQGREPGNCMPQGTCIRVQTAARAVRRSSRQISSALDSAGSRASQHSRPLHQDPGVWDTQWLCCRRRRCSPPWRPVGSLLGHLVTF